MGKKSLRSKSKTPSEKEVIETPSPNSMHTISMTSAKKAPELKVEKVVPTQVIDQLNLNKSALPSSQSSLGQPSPSIGNISNEQIQIHVDTNDPHLWSKSRIMVPVDVQALVVEPSSSNQSIKSAWKSVSGNRSATNQYADKWASLETTFEADPNTSEIMAKHNEAFTYSNIVSGHLPLPEGIHLHWAMPDALLHGELIEDDEITDEYLNPNDMVEYQGSMITVASAIEQGLEIPLNEDNSKTISESISFPQLPDRWLIARHWTEENTKHKKYWVIESDSLKVTELNKWNPPEPQQNPQPEMTAIGPHSGDTLWTVTYDNAAGRFTFHDNPGRHISGPLHYTVCGWYSKKENDPLYAPSSLSEIEWFRRVREDLRWAVDENSINIHAEYKESFNSMNSMVFANLKTSTGGEN